MISSGGTVGGFQKWQLAIALGTTGVLGLGYWYLNRNSRTKLKVSASIEKSPSLDAASGDNNVSKNVKSPLHQAQQYKNDGNVAFKAGKYDEAIAHYNKAIETCPLEMKSDLATFYQNRAAAYEQLKKWSAVRDDCTKALELNPSYTKALFRRARAAENTNDLVMALEDITAVCFMEKFQNQSTLFMADRILRQLGAKHAKEAFEKRVPVMPSKHFIKIYFSAFTEDPILNRLETFEISEDPSESKGFMKALQLLKCGEYDDVIAACTEEIDSSESEAQFKTEAVVLRGTFYLLIGKHDDAVTDFQSVIDNPLVDVKLRVNALIKLAALHMQVEKPELSMSNFLKAAEIDPKNCDVYHHRAQYHLLLSQVSEASNDFSKAIELNPNYAVAHAQKCYTDYRQALSTMNVDRLPSVMEEFQNVIKRFPNCCESYSMYAQVLTDQQKFIEADQYFQKTMTVDPDNATVYVQRAVLQLQSTNNIEKSIELINTALEKDPKCEYAYEALGSIEVQQGNLQRAIELFEKAILLAKTEAEMTHLFSLKDAATAQLNIANKLGVDYSSILKNATPL